MDKGTFSNSVMILTALALASCTKAESSQQCVERFAEHFANEQLFDTGSWRSMLTYRLPHDFKVAEAMKSVGRDKSKHGTTFTFAKGTKHSALDSFSRREVGINGAYLTVDDTTYFRTGGAVGSPRQTVVSGCENGPKGSKLIRIDWTSLQDGTLNLSAPG